MPITNYKGHKIVVMWEEAVAAYCYEICDGNFTNPVARDDPYRREGFRSDNAALIEAKAEVDHIIQKQLNTNEHEK